MNEAIRLIGEEIQNKKKLIEKNKHHIEKSEHFIDECYIETKILEKDLNELKKSGRKNINGKYKEML